jgi:D-alanyl-D-alanine carboxypeptidase
MRSLRPFSSAGALAVLASGAIAAMLLVGAVPAQAATASADFDRTKHSLDDPASSWVIANKLRPLQPTNWVPDDLVRLKVPQVYDAYLRKPAAKAVTRMFADFQKKTGLGMQSQSAYRSYSSQVSTYNSWVDTLGQEGADLTSARPGYSEHQTGLAIDISAVGGSCSLRSCFADTKQGKWLAKHAWEYGFVLRYPQGKTKITGYEFEPWHYRFVGTGLARDLHETGVKTLEKYFGLPNATDYE